MATIAYCQKQLAQLQGQVNRLGSAVKKQGRQPTGGKGGGRNGKPKKTSQANSQIKPFDCSACGTKHLPWQHAVAGINTMRAQWKSKGDPMGIRR